MTPISKEKERCVPCDDCGREIKAPVFMGIQVRRYCPPCRDRRLEAFNEQQEEERQMSLSRQYVRWQTAVEGGIPWRYRGHSWEDFIPADTPDMQRAYAAARSYASRFPLDSPREYPSLLLIGAGYGVGKTMLSCLILQEVMQNAPLLGEHQYPYQFWSSADLRYRLEAAERFNSKESVAEVYAELGQLRLLVLDDVGKEAGWGRDAKNEMFYYTLLNARNNASLPMVITSNVGVEGEPNLRDLLGRAAWDRLTEMTGHQYYMLNGKDRR